jgi:DNA polymerase-4
MLRHPELDRLTIAHIDCDAFYASIEKRDDPSLKDKPVIVGGGRRGVVSTCCYVARLYGVRSAMPMFKALRACPQAVVIKPRMSKYATVAREVREMMRTLTPLVEPVSLDEAYLDLTGTERLMHGSPALTLARLAARIEREIGITVSVGLSFNKFLAKQASEMDKPRGFAVIGRAGIREFLAPRAVGTILGVGKAMQAKLADAGIQTIGDLQRETPEDLMRRFGAMGARLARLSVGDDDRPVDPEGETKSVSAETTFNEDLRKLDELEHELWPLCEKVSRRLKAAGLAGRTVTLKLKTDDFRIRTRAESLPHATQLAEVIYRDARALLAKEADGTAFRLIGVGLSHFDTPEAADPPDLLDRRPGQLRAVESAIDKVRAKFGEAAIGKGRGLLLGEPAVSSRPAASPDGPARPSAHRKDSPARDRR